MATTVKQPELPAEQVPAEVIATSIAQIAAGMKAINARINAHLR